MILNKDLKVDLISDYLKGKSIAICITGGIAAIETPKIIRQLRRYGAEVRAYMTTEAVKFVGKTALEWATEQEVITELSGRSEHICRENIILVAPATTNTINKIFAGIADNPVTTLIASAIGENKPILIAPCMHESLYRNPFLQSNLKSASKYNIKIIEPRFSEGKAKIAHTDKIVAEMLRELSDDPIKGKKILVTAGPTPVKIDSVRIITTSFKGTTGIEIAKELYFRGAYVKLLLSKNAIAAPEYINREIFETYDDYYSKVFAELKKGYDAAIFSAAVADYRPSKFYEGKIPSGGILKEIKMVPTQKVIDDVRQKYPELFMVTFKFTIGTSKEELMEIAKSRLEKFQVIVANRGEEMLDSHHAYILARDGDILEPSNKQEIASMLADKMGGLFGQFI